MALEALCKIYWYPLYLYVRRKGHSPQDAEDLTQAFFERLIEKDILSATSPEKGKFRSFLLVSLKNFLINDWSRGQTQKRGGGQTLLSIQELDGESRYLNEPQNQENADCLYDRAWARTLLDHVLNSLEKDYSHAGKSGLFHELKPFLEGETPLSYAQIAEKHHISEAAVKMAVLRLRKRFAEKLKGEVLSTLADATTFEEEFKHLLRVLAASR